MKKYEMLDTASLKGAIIKDIYPVGTQYICIDCEGHKRAVIEAMQILTLEQLRNTAYAELHWISKEEAQNRATEILKLERAMKEGFKQ